MRVTMRVRLMPGTRSRIRRCGVVAFALGALTSPPGVAADQGQDTLPAYRTVAGRLNAQYLPYGTRFRIRGSIETPAGGAEVVRLSVRDMSKARVKDDIPSSCWVRSGIGPAADTVFDVAVNRPLRLERAYYLKLEYFRRTPTPEIEALAAEVVRTVVDSLQRRGLMQLDLETTQQAWSAEILRRFATRGGRMLSFGRLGLCPDSVGTSRVIQLTPAQVATIQLAVLHWGRRNRAADSLQAYRNRFAAVTLAPGYFPLRARLRVLAGDTAVRRRFGFDSSLVQQTLDAFDNETAVPDPAEAGMRRLAAPVVAHPLTDAERLLLKNLLDGESDLQVEKGKWLSAGVLAESSITDARALRPAIEREFVNLASTELTETAWTDSTTAKALRIGTAFALGPVLVDGSSADVVALALLKFHFGAVDRRHPDAWAEPSARWALNVGVKIKSDLNYKGQKQEDLFNGLMPAVGLSWDRDRLLSINVGALLFRQPSPNPFNQGKKSAPKAGFYAMVGFELNLINRLTDFFK